MFFSKFYNMCASKGSKPNPVGKIVGISSSTITQWKQGAIPSGENLVKISNYLDCSIDYLLDRTENPQSHKEVPYLNVTDSEIGNEACELLKIFDGLNEEGKSALMAMARGFSAESRYKKCSEISEEIS